MRPGRRRVRGTGCPPRSARMPTCLCQLCARRCTISTRGIRPLPGATERRGRTAKPGLRPAGLRSRRPDREEALLPLPARQPRRIRWARSGCPLSCKFCQNWQISQARPGDFDAGYVTPAGRRRRGRPPRLAGGRVHVQRADGVRRVRPRHRRRRAPARAAVRDGQLRLHERAAAGRPVRRARRDQDRSQGLQRRLLPHRVGRRARAGAAQHCRRCGRPACISRS